VFIVSVVFKHGVLHALQLLHPTVDPEGRTGWLGWDRAREMAAARDNGVWVKDTFGSEPCSLSWGKIDAGYSEQDARNYVVVVYGSSGGDRSG
jgi:hypothetical protein